MRIILILFLVICTTFQLSAGLFDDRYPSPKATAMGGSGAATNGDVWASYYNPASLSSIGKLQVGTSYLRLFNLSFFKNFFGAAAYPLPKKYGTASFSVQYFGVDYEGNNLNGEYTFALSHGFYLLKDIHSSLAAGYSIKAYYWDLGESLQFGDLGSSTTLGVDVGLQASIYSRTFLGVYFLNINSPQVGETIKHDLPQRVVIGIAYQPYDGVTTSLDFNRVVGVGDMQLWAGAEFNVFRNLYLRFGGTTNPNRLSGGLGIHIAQFKVDYALVTHNELGETHQFGLIVSF
jgi:hypothetical protein